MSQKYTNILMMIMGLMVSIVGVGLLKWEIDTPVVGEHGFLLITFGASIIVGIMCFVTGVYCYRNDM